jgi:hypothetical protein
MMTPLGELLTSQTKSNWLQSMNGNDFQGINDFNSSLKVILDKTR